MTPYQKLRRALDHMAVVDTHTDSIPCSGYWLQGKPYEEWLKRGDMFARHPGLAHILNSVWLFSAIDLARNESDFAAISRSLRRITGQGHLRVAIRAINEIYGVDISSFDEHVLREASQKISEAYEKRDWIATLLRKYAKIEIAVLDQTPTYSLWGGMFDRTILAGSLKIDMFLHAYNRDAAASTRTGESAYAFADMLGVQIASFDDYLAFIDRVFNEARQNGFIAIKTTIAYDRGLRFEEVDESEGKRAFGKPSKDLSKAEISKFGDFIMHYIIRRATEVGFPIQIHTGMVYRGDYENSNPLKLANLIIKYPETKFVVFHAGYPWVSETGSLLWSHRNVYADLCWIPMSSPTAAERAVSEFIEMSGGERITCGDDTASAEGACGALAVAKDVVARVVAEYAERRYFTYGDALAVAKRIFSENAREIYRR
jgi:predicted TIM-barrel fold metal-dependent hydrolase